MIWAGRPTNQTFGAGEALFCRVNTEMLDVDPAGGVTLNIRVGDQSVNRTDPDGQWDDVLLHEHPKFVDWGVVTFAVGLIPTPQVRADADPIHYRPVHDPEPCNFYHSEIRIFRATEDGQQITRDKAKPSMKTWLRTKLAEQLTTANILKYPQPGSGPAAQ